MGGHEHLAHQGTRDSSSPGKSEVGTVPVRERGRPGADCACWCTRTRSAEELLELRRDGLRADGRDTRSLSPVPCRERPGAADVQDAAPEGCSRARAVDGEPSSKRRHLIAPVERRQTSTHAGALSSPSCECALAPVDAACRPWTRDAFAADSRASHPAADSIRACSFTRLQGCRDPICSRSTILACGPSRNGPVLPARTARTSLVRAQPVLEYSDPEYGLLPSPSIVALRPLSIAERRRRSGAASLPMRRRGLHP